MAKFEVTLRNNKTKQYNSMAVFIVLLNIAVFMLTFFYSAEQSVRRAAMSGTVLCAIALTADIVYRRKGKDLGKLHNLPLLLATLTWLFIGNVWAIVLCAGLMFLFSVSQRQLRVGIDKEAVQYPSFPQRNIRWNELNNVILKDGLLTIDFKNNKILQSEITESSALLSEQELNDFCRQQLRASNVKEQA